MLLKGGDFLQFGDIIKLLRKERNISQQELADAINISKSAISMYEINQRVPELETFEAIADYFNVEMDYLMGKTDIRRKYTFTDNEDYRNEDAFNKILMTKNQTMIDIINKIAAMDNKELEILNKLLR